MQDIKSPVLFDGVAGCETQRRLPARRRRVPVFSGVRIGMHGPIRAQGHSVNIGVWYGTVPFEPRLMGPTVQHRASPIASDSHDHTFQRKLAFSRAVLEVFDECFSGEIQFAQPCCQADSAGERHRTYASQAGFCAAYEGIVFQ